MKRSKQTVIVLTTGKGIGHPKAVIDVP